MENDGAVGPLITVHHCKWKVFYLFIFFCHIGHLCGKQSMKTRLVGCFGTAHVVHAST